MGVKIGNNNKIMYSNIGKSQSITLCDLIENIKSKNGIYSTEISNAEDITKMKIIIKYHLEGDNFIATFNCYTSEMIIKEDL